MKNNKERYEAPEVETVEIKAEGMVCASGLSNPTDYPGTMDPFNF